jgi:hypothetical protein
MGAEFESIKRGLQDAIEHAESRLAVSDMGAPSPPCGYAVSIPDGGHNEKQFSHLSRVLIGKIAAPGSGRPASGSTGTAANECD